MIICNILCVIYHIFFIIEFITYYYRCKTITCYLVSNCYPDVYLETANQAIRCCETHALLTDGTSSTEALQKKSVPSGLVVLHAADLAA